MFIRISTLPILLSTLLGGAVPALGDTVTVENASDFPAPVANVIKLVVGKAYDTVALVTLPNGVSINAQGATLTSKVGRFPNFGIEGNVAGPLVFQTAGECEINNIIVRNLNAGGKCLDMVGDNFVTSKCSWECANTIGDIDCDTLFVDAGNVDGLGSATSGITITGDVIAHTMNVALFTGIIGPNIVFDSAMALPSFGTIVLQGNAFLLSGSLAGIKDERVTKTGRVLLTDNQFNGSSAPLDGLGKGDPQITLKGNLGLPNANGNTDPFFDANQASSDTIELVLDTETDVIIDDWVIEEQSLWTVSPTTGKSTYDGLDTLKFNYVFEVTVTKVGGGTRDVTFRLILNGVTLRTEPLLALDTTPRKVTFHSSRSTSTTFELKLTAENLGATSDFIFSVAHQQAG